MAIDYKISIDPSRYLTAMKQVTASTKAASTALVEWSKAIKAASTAIQQLGNTTRRVLRFEEPLKQITRFNTALVSTRQRYREVRREAEFFVRGTAVVPAAAAGAGAGAGAGGRATRRATLDLNRLADVARRSGASQRAAANAARYLSSSLGRVGTASRTSSTLLNRFKSSIVSQVASFYLLARAVRATIGTMVKYEDTMAQVKAITGASAEEFTKLDERVRQLGATTRFTASEVASGLTFLARGGLEAEQASIALSGTLNLASAGFISVGQAADFTINALKQFQLDAGESVRVADSLVAAANSSNTSVEQLGVTMSYAGSVAGAVGVEFEELAAASGILANAGIKASRAGTGLRGIIATLLKPATAARKKLKELGLSARDVSPNFHSLETIFRRLGERTSDAADLTTIFRKRQLAAAIALTQAATAADDAQYNFGRYVNKIKESKGESTKVATIVEDTLGGAFRRFKSAIEAAILSNRGFASGLRDVFEVGTGVIRVFLGMADAQTRSNEAVRSAITGVKIFISIVAALITKMVILRAVAAAAWFAANPLLGVLTLIGSTVAGAAVATSRWSDEVTESDASAAKWTGTLGHLNTELRSLINLGRQEVDYEAKTVRIAQSAIDLAKERIKEHELAVKTLAAAAAGGDQGIAVEMGQDFAGLSTKDIRDGIRRWRRKFVAEFTGQLGAGSQGAATLENILTEAIQKVWAAPTDRISVAKEGPLGALFAAQGKAAGEVFQSEFGKRLFIPRPEDMTQANAAALAEQLAQQLGTSTKAAEQLKTVGLDVVYEALALRLEKFTRILEEANNAWSMRAAVLEREARVADKVREIWDSLVETVKNWGAVTAASVRGGAKDVERWFDGIVKAAKDKRKVQEFIDSLKNQVEVMKLRNAALREGNKALEDEADLLELKFKLEALNAGISATKLAQAREEYLALKRLREENERLNAEEKKKKKKKGEEKEKVERDPYAESVNQLVQNQILLQKELNGATEVELELQRLLFALKNQGVTVDDPAELKLLLEQNKQLEDTLELSKAIEDTLSGAFTDLFSALVSGTESLEDALKSFLQNLTQQLSDLFAQRFFQQLFGGLFPAPAAAPAAGVGPGLPGAGVPSHANPIARGGVFSSPVRPFAAGGIVRRPTYFAAGGTVGLMGEAGAEAILPLGRDDKGRLGVRGGGGTTVVVNVSTPDANSFIKSKRQVAAAAQRALQAGNI